VDGLKKAIGEGFTLIELLVVISLVAILGTLLFDRMQLYQEQAERVSVEQTLGTIRSGLRMRFAEGVLNGGGPRLSLIANENPIDVLVEPPQNYGGETGDANTSLVKGMWYFDTKRRELVYRPNLDAHLRLSEGETLLRFKVLLLGMPPESASGTFRYSGIRLVPAMRYQWF